jgi:hypothetical protein
MEELKAELEEIEKRRAEILYQMYIIVKYDIDS